jgi:hypothetical protein
MIMPDPKQQDSEQKRIKREQNGSSGQGGQERQQNGYRQDPGQKGDRERNP